MIASTSLTACLLAGTITLTLLPPLPFGGGPARSLSRQAPPDQLLSATSDNTVLGPNAIGSSVPIPSVTITSIQTPGPSDTPADTATVEDTVTGTTTNTATTTGTVTAPVTTVLTSSPTVVLSTTPTATETGTLMPTISLTPPMPTAISSVTATTSGTPSPTPTATTTVAATSTSTPTTGLTPSPTPTATATPVICSVDTTIVGWRITTEPGDPDQSGGFLPATITPAAWSGLAGTTFSSIPVPVDKLVDPGDPKGPDGMWDGQCALAPIVLPVNKMVTLFGFQMSLTDITLDSSGVTLGDTTINFPNKVPGSPRVSLSDVLIAGDGTSVSGGQAVLSSFNGKLTVIAGDIHLKSGELQAGTVDINLPPILGDTANLGITGFLLSYSGGAFSVQGRLSSFTFQMRSATVTVSNASLDGDGTIRIESAAVHLEMIGAKLDVAVSGLSYNPGTNALLVDKADAKFKLPHFSVGKFGIDGEIRLELTTKYGPLVYRFSGDAILATPAITLKASIVFGSSGEGVIGVDGKEHAYILYRLALNATLNTGITIPYTPLELYGLGGELEIAGTAAAPIYYFSVNTSIRTIDKGLLLDAETLKGTLGTDGNFKLEGSGSLFNVPQADGGKAALLLGKGTACLILSANDGTFCKLSIDTKQPGAYLEMQASTDPGTFIGRQVTLKGNVTGQLTLKDRKPSVSAMFKGDIGVPSLGLSGALKEGSISLSYRSDQPVYQMGVDAEMHTDSSTTIGQELPTEAHFTGKLLLQPGQLTISANFDGKGTIYRLGLSATMNGQLGQFNRNGEDNPYFGIKGTGSGQVPAFDLLNFRSYLATVTVPFFAGLAAGSVVPTICTYSTLPPSFCSTGGFTAVAAALVQSPATLPAARPAQSGTKDIPFTVTMAQPDLIAALTWKYGAPSLTLVTPTGEQIPVATAAHDPTVDAPSGGHATLLIANASSVPGTWYAHISNLQGNEQEQFNYAAIASSSISQSNGPLQRQAPSETYRVAGVLQRSEQER